MQEYAGAEGIAGGGKDRIATYATRDAPAG
jgi:hypothetical protein